MRRDATGLGVVFCLEAILDHLGWELSGSRVAIQGFGKVGAVVARELARRGARVVAITDVAGGSRQRGGLDLEALERVGRRQPLHPRLSRAARRSTATRS